MDFKMQEQWRVQKQLMMSDKQLKKAIDVMIKRHPRESWIDEHYGVNGDTVPYLKLEFVEWIKEVYLATGYYLDLEIAFFQKQVVRLENELGIPHITYLYCDMSLDELPHFFNKRKDTIRVAITRLCNSCSGDVKYVLDGKTFISKDGIKWLYEKYFRKSYLRDLEIYKLELQKRKAQLYEFQN